jgi:hypothetical protein
VDSTLQAFLTSLPFAIAIWSIMLVVVGGLAAALVTAGRPAEKSARLSDNDDERFAAEIAVAADRAAVTAGRRRLDWQDAQEAVDAAWAAYREADARATRTAAACAFPTPARRRRPGENVDRERYLHRSATAACRRHEISIRQLNEALAHRGWNPRLHPVVQEAALCNAIRANRLAEWRAATDRERATWATAEAAADALRSLRAEALTARMAVGLDLRPVSEPWWAERGSATQPLPVLPAVPAVPAIPRQSTVDNRHPVAA